MKNVLFTTNIPSPYRIDFFNELGKYCHLTVAFESAYSKSKNRVGSWHAYDFCNFEAEIIAVNKSLKNGHPTSFAGVAKSRKFDSIVIGEYSSPQQMRMICYLRRKHIPYLINTDGGFSKQGERWLRSAVKKHFIGGASGYLSTSAAADRYLEYYGADPGVIHRYPFTSVRANEIVSELTPAAERIAIKERLGIIENFMLLQVGSLISRKGVDLLLRAEASLPDDVAVVFAGHGDFDTYCELGAKIARKVSRVYFLGHKDREDLAQCYRCADALVMPTREDVCGIVVNEAMANGLPIIVSDACLAATELVVDGENGRIVRSEDVAALSAACNELIADADFRKRASLRSLELIQPFTIENMAAVHAKILRLDND